jgi:hypothetical protein
VTGYRGLPRPQKVSCHSLKAADFLGFNQFGGNTRHLYAQKIHKPPIFQLITGNMVI